MIINLDPIQFLKSQLPAHKLQNNRIKLFKIPFKELGTISQDYNLWRNTRLIEQNINHSTKVLEWWLNRQVGSGISIIENEENENYITLSTQLENDNFILLSTQSEAVNSVLLALNGEPGDVDLSTDFAVLAPTGTDQMAIIEIIERYRAAGTTWQIIYY